MKTYMYLIRGHKSATYVMVNATNEDDAQIKAVDTFNTVTDDVALRVYEV